MIAKIEDNKIKVFDGSIEIGSIELVKPQYEHTDILIGDKKYSIIKNGWNFTVSDDEHLITHLKMNSFWGDITVIEFNKKIKGVFSLKWGTQMVDENNNTLLKIKNDNLIIDNGNFEIKIEDKSVSHLDIMLSLFGHLFGSNSKLLSVVATS